MKISKIMSFTLGLLFLTTVACKDEFLEIPATGSLTQVELSSLDGIEGALISSYSELLGRDGFYSDASNWYFGSVMGGEANKGSNAGDQSQVNEIQSYASQSTNASIAEKYRVLYEGIARANATLLLISQAIPQVSEGDKTRMAAEARFLRGHYYFDLKKIFNNTPYIDETWDEVTPVTNEADLWPFIEADFLFAYDNLPETQSDAGRANKWSAGSYLAKTYLYQAKYAEAKTVFDDVIANGVTANCSPYALLTNFNDVFRVTNDNSAEAVFSSQAAAGTGDVNNANPSLILNYPHNNGSGGGPSSCCGFNQPSFDLVNSFRTGSDGLPLLDGSYNNAANAVVNDMGLAVDAAFTPDTGNLDPRLDHSVGRRTIPYLDWGDHPGIGWVRDQAYAGPYAPKKYIFYANAAGVPENDGSSWISSYTTVNVHIIRFADVLLMAAEVEAELNNLSTALGYVNQVRTRAANSLLQNSAGTDAANYVINNYTSFASQEQAISAVRFERRLELSGEGHRFYDLNRWGIAEATLTAYMAHESQYISGPFDGASFSSTDVYLPIPQSEIDLLGEDVIIQNDGY